MKKIFIYIILILIIGFGLTVQSYAILILSGDCNITNPLNSDPSVGNCIG
jgi:hypothetical protein